MTGLQRAHYCMVQRSGRFVTRGVRAQDSGLPLRTTRRLTVRRETPPLAIRPRSEASLLHLGSQVLAPADKAPQFSDLDRSATVLAVPRAGNADRQGGELMPGSGALQARRALLDRSGMRCGHRAVLDWHGADCSDLRPTSRLRSSRSPSLALVAMLAVSACGGSSTASGGGGRQRRLADPGRLLHPGGGLPRADPGVQQDARGQGRQLRPVLRLLRRAVARGRGRPSGRCRGLLPRARHDPAGGGRSGRRGLEPERARRAWSPTRSWCSWSARATRRTSRPGTT